MSQIGNKLRAGFFATPDLQGEYIGKLLNVSGSGSFLDPMCGEGEVLNQIRSMHQTEDTNIATYAVELDKTRANKAQKILDLCINASVESIVVSNNAFSLLYLNPPYDRTMKGMEDNGTERKEWTELVRNVRYLKESGLMVYIIPGYRFADKKIARYLATNFEEVGILRFSDEDYGDFKQCIFIGNKKRGKRKVLNPDLHDFLLNMGDEEFVLERVTPINLMIGRKLWNVPAGEIEIKTFYTRLEDKFKYYEGIIGSKGFSSFKERSKPKSLEVGGNPCLPINQGQMALLLASGAVNGEIGTGEHYHLVQGLEIVSKIVEEEKKIHDNGSVTSITKERTKREVSVKVITPTGNITKLV